MANFQVPQFIEVEDQIFGPLTFKQFVYLAGGAGAVWLIWALIPIKLLALIAAAPVAGLALALAFYKINNRPFIAVMESAFRYLTSSKLFIWHKKEVKPGAELNALPTAAPTRGIPVPKLSQSKLKDLAWSLDVKETVK